MREESADKRIRILIVAPSSELIGGQTVQASRLLQHLGQEPSLIVHQLATNISLPKPVQWVRKLKYFRTIINWPLYVVRLLWRVHRYDLLHIFSSHNTSFLITSTPAILLAKVFQKAAILHYHSGFAAEHLRLWGKTAIPTMRMADAIVVPSDFLVDVFGSYGLAAQPIHNFVDTDQFVCRIRDGLRPLFMANRALEDNYNIGCILKAFALIQKSFPEAALIIAGDGPRRGELENLAASLGLKNVRFLGWIPPAKMADLYQEADIYLNSPDVDNMPNAIIEAFASGVPVVSTNAGGIPYLITDSRNGLLVDCNDYQSMAGKAIELLNNSSLARNIAEAARERCNEYTYSRVREKWVRMYEEVMDRRAKSKRRTDEKIR